MAATPDMGSTHLAEPNGAGEDSSDDDAPALSSRALEALKEFLSEQQRDFVREGDEEDDEGEGGVSLVAEDWRMSQFWYDPETAVTVAEEIRRLCRSTGSAVACIACPTLYAYIKKMDPNIPAKLLEYDRRFEQYGGDFTFYDYNQPEELPTEMKHAFHVVVADPPYLSEECLTKVSDTISFLARPYQSYVLLLTGDVQRERAAELLNLHPCGFRPRHSSKLGNEFRLFTSYDPSDRLGGWQKDS